jgi:hypothetical protein
VAFFDSALASLSTVPETKDKLSPNQLMPPGEPIVSAEDKASITLAIKFSDGRMVLFLGEAISPTLDSTSRRQESVQSDVSGG